MQALDFNGAAIWSLAIIAGPILLGRARHRLQNPCAVNRRQGTCHSQSPKHGDACDHPDNKCAFLR